MDTSVYNHLLGTFNPKYTTKYVNDPKQLRSVVKKIRQITQTSPVYLLDFSNDKQSFVLGMKEYSMKINESLMTMADDSPDSVFEKKKASSSDTKQVKATLINDNEEQLPSPFTIQVKNLANSQINIGKEFYETGKGLAAGTYQFKVTVNDAGYDFQYNIKDDANHRDVIGGLCKFITKAKIGIDAQPVSREAGKIAMRLESTSVGTPDGDVTFRFEDTGTNKQPHGIVDYYAMNQVSVMPKSAEFTLNGAKKTSMSNTFTLGRAVEVSLLNPFDQEARVDYHPDSDLIIERVQDFVDDYNTIVKNNVSFEKKTDTPAKLLRELKGIIGSSKNELEAAGLNFNQDGAIELDTSLAMQAIEDGDMQKLFSKESPFVNRLFTKMDSVKLNPVEYIDKKIVSYPDYSKPAKGYSYITSLYSGLIFNSYC